MIRIIGMSPLAKHEKKTLLGLARRSMERKVLSRPLEIEVVPEGTLHQAAGSFVSLHILEELRGCIGRIRSTDPLFRIVQEMAVAAATQDPRFLPVSPEELEKITVEISVLSIPEPLKDIRDLEVGRHGLIVSSRGHSGILLPQVAAEYSWDSETFLSHTCAKAGLPMDFWTYGKLLIEYFSAEVFSEEDIL